MAINACPKPAYGTAKLAHNERRTKRTTRSRNVKEQVKAADGRRCRFPNCQMQRQGFVLDAAHRKAAGMGGNPDLSRMVPENLISMCRFHHRGAFSMHSGDIKPVPRDEGLGMRGPVDFYVTDEQKKWTHVGTTSPVHRIADEESAA